MGKVKEFIENVRDVISANPKGRRYDAAGRYYPDPTPLAPPVGYRKEPSIMDKVRDLVRSEKLRAEVEAAGAETFEEADDFNIGDPQDYDPRSPFELVFEPGGDRPWSEFVEETARLHPSFAKPGVHQEPNADEGRVASPGPGNAPATPPSPEGGKSGT